MKVIVNSNQWRQQITEAPSTEPNILSDLFEYRNWEHVKEFQVNVSLKKYYAGRWLMCKKIGHDLQNCKHAQVKLFPFIGSKFKLEIYYTFLIPCPY